MHFWCLSERVSSKVSPTFPAALFQWMRGSRVKLKGLKQAFSELIRQSQRKQMKGQVLNITSNAKNLQICCTRLIQIVHNKQVFEN